jgi:hypothetical protein
MEACVIYPNLNSLPYRQCPKRLWLEVHKPELRDDSGLQAAFARGHDVGKVAQQIFDSEGVGHNVDPNLIGWNASAEQTEVALQAGEGPVFEALLQVPGAMALADVMRPDSNFSELHWEMIEVKASTKIKDYHRDDVAIQNYIADQSGVPLSKSFSSAHRHQFCLSRPGRLHRVATSGRFDQRSPRAG